MKRIHDDASITEALRRARKSEKQASSIKKGTTMQRAFLRLISALALTWVCSSPAPVVAQTPAEDHAANIGMILHMHRMRAFHDVDTGTQSTPPVIGQNTTDEDPTGTISTFQPGGNTHTAGNAFFQNLGTNGRTCFTCHQPATGWGVSAQSVQDRFNASSGADPIFRLVDGATCPTADVSTPDKQLQAYSLLLSKGLIRIGLPIPANAEFQISVVNDPYNCNTNPATGLTSSTSGIVSIYRRPLPSTNLDFLSAIMW